jgi:hypothetical protein
MRAMLILGLCTLALPTDALGWGRKKKATAPDTWAPNAEGQPHCYHPPAWDDLSTIDRKMKRSEVMDTILSQWRGEREDGLSFDSGIVDKLDTVLLGRPEKIEAVAADNLSRCLAADTAAWESWARGLPAQLTAGECNTNFDYTLFDHLDIQSGWQGGRPICKGNKIVIKTSSKDRYRITEDGPWITVAGDPAISTSGTEDWPCNIEGCLAGGMMFRFVGKSGQESIYVAGSKLVFTAPEHGRIDYRINDTQFFDNTWYQARGIIDHASVEISPSR